MGAKKARRKKAAKRTPTVDLKEEIEKELSRSGYRRTHRNNMFVSLDFIAGLFKSTNPPKLQQSIKTDLEALKNEGIDLQVENKMIEELVAYVRKEAAKLYAILLLLGHSQRIYTLYNEDHPVTDRIFEQGENNCDVSYCSLDYLKATHYLSDIAVEIFEKQWCIPPILCQQIDQIYPLGLFRFPFEAKPEPIGRGGYGGVYKVKVAKGHLRTGNHSYVRGSVVAYKEVTKRESMTEERVMREVNTIRARKHQSIVPFFADFSAGRENPWRENEKVECLHMLFEHTDASTMQDWLTSDSAPAPLADVAERRKYITNCIESLISALTFIHSEINGFIAYHHDLKPANILLFKGPPDIWKICDFGMANLRHHEENSGTTQGPGNRFGTYDYQPPEYFADEPDPKHGRPFDVYSLGCIILELATVWIHGWSKAGISEFRCLRGENTEHACKRPGKPNPDCSFHNSPNVVEDWIQHLREGTNGDERLECLLHLISEMLVGRARRVFIWEVNMDLYEMGGSRTPKQLRTYLRKLVQPSDTSLNDLNNEHNPLKRAIRKNKSWQKEILEQYKWSVKKPEPNNQLRIERRETGLYHTTLKACPQTNEFEHNSLFGRHEMDVKIAEGLRISNCVGLYGMSGMGKSHLAYHYVVRFRDTNSIEDRKHTFWVEANNEARFRETVGRIAEEIQLEVSEPEDLLLRLNQWLSDCFNGPWIMVVDSLDYSAVAALKRLLPTDSGQVLITTKNRAILDSLEDFFPPRERKKVCLQVERLAVSECQLVFQWHNDDVLPSNSEMGELLSKFSSPVLIKIVAKYFLNNNIPTSELYKSMKEGKTQKFQERVYKDFSKGYLIFEPLIASLSLRSAPFTKFSRWPSVELKLLGELSYLNKDEIDIRLIQQNYENEARLWEMLGLLENCSYIGKGRDGKAPCYFMHETVQELVRQWVLTNMGPMALMHLYETVLCMLITLYKEDKSTKDDAKKIRRSSYLWKLCFMAHFDRFLDFAREFTTELKLIDDFQYSDRMVHSVITFSQVYLDEGRYEDAVCVLEFARNLYKCTKYRPHLVRHLSKAYILPPLSRTRKEEWTKAATMLEEVIPKCGGQADCEQRWRCVLDIADLYSKSSRPEDASAALRGLSEVSIGSNHGGPILQRRGKQIFDEETELKLAITKRIAEAKVHVARADCSTTPAVKDKELMNAHAAYDHAISAISSWFPSEDKWVLEVEEGIAKVLCRKSDPHSSNEAIRIFRKLLDSLKAEFHAPNRAWSQKRMWDVECQIACAQLQLGAGWEELAITTLDRVLDLYERCYGKRGGQHDEHTRACAYHLHEAYEKVGNASKAQEIVKRYSLQSVNYVRFPDVVVERRLLNKRSCTITLLVAFILVYLYCFRHSATGIRNG